MAGERVIGIDLAGDRKARADFPAPAVSLGI